MAGRRMRWRTVGALAALWAVLAAPIHAEPYPSKLVHIVVPTSAGGITDLLGRMVANQITVKTGAQAIVDNRAGAGGNLGMESVARAPADGYTLLFANSSYIVMAPYIYRHMTVDPLTELAPVGPIGHAPQLLIVNARLPVTTLQEFIAYAKARPGQLNYASAGLGSTVHLAGDQFVRLAGIDVVHVPYRGTTPAVRDLAAGSVDMISVSLGPVEPFVASGALRILAAAWPTRLAALPDVPTAAEAGLPGYEMTTWFALFAPQGTPVEIVDMLNKLILDMLDDPASLKRLADNSVELMRISPAEFGRFIRADAAKWKETIAASHIELQ
jgi:tripartite-type tricarboxylate transporter receptor subunit TctC